MSTPYAYSTDIAVRITDIDRGEHVNNAVFLEYLQQARIEYLDQLVGYFDDGPYIVVVDLRMQFEASASWGETVTVDLRVPEIGGSSFRIEYRLRVGETTVATAETTMVTFDREAGSAMPLPENWRDRLTADNEASFDHEP